MYYILCIIIYLYTAQNTLLLWHSITADDCFSVKIRILIQFILQKAFKFFPRRIL